MGPERFSGDGLWRLKNGYQINTLMRTRKNQFCRKVTTWRSEAPGKPQLVFTLRERS